MGEYFNNHEQPKRDWRERQGEGASAAKPRTPPYSMEAERSVLGAILLNNVILDKVLEAGVEARDFYKEAHQRIFEAMQALYERKDVIDMITITATLKDRGYFEVIGGTGTLTQLLEDQFAIANAVQYAKIVHEKAILRRMIDTCTEIVNEAMEGVDVLEPFMDQVETKILTVADTSLSKSFVDMKSVILANVMNIEQLALNKKDIVGLPTGFTDYDKLSTGLHPGQIIIIAARPGMGKTSWLTSMISHVAIKEKAVVAFFSLEMTANELGYKFLSGHSRLDSKNLKVGRLSDRDWRKLTETADQLAGARILMDDSGGLSVMDVRSRCRRMLASEKKLDLIVIDYLQLMKGSKSSNRNGDNREREISEISRGLKELAKELKVPIIALSQLSRNVESRVDKRPMLSDLRESGSIEQDADMVCFIYRDEYYNKESEDKGIAEFIVAKNRAGPTETIKLAWLGQYTTFENLAPDQSHSG